MVDISKVRDQLKSRLETLNQRIGKIEGGLRSTLIEAQQVHAAIVRIDDGTYGECSTCGEPIGEKRLQALPYAIQCIDCVTE
jgi:RNA polymerase-binding transcription factor DksA